MMQRFYTFSLLMIAAFVFQDLNAQTCTPDAMLPDSVIVSPLPYRDSFPDRGIADTACVNTYFETVLQINVPESIMLGGFEVMVEQVRVNEDEENPIENLPAGFDYICNPPNCTFVPDTIGCIVVYGTAPAGAEDIYDVKINVVLETNVLDADYTLPDPLLAPGNYFLHVQPEGSPNCTVINDVADYGTTDALRVQLQPNPTAGLTRLQAQVAEGGNYTLRISDMLGQQVYTESVGLLPGENQVAINATTLPAGIYVYSLDNGVVGVAGRLIVQK